MNIGRSKVIAKEFYDQSLIYAVEICKCRNLFEQLEIEKESRTLNKAEYWTYTNIKYRMLELEDNREANEQKIYDLFDQIGGTE